MPNASSVVAPSILTFERKPCSRQRSRHPIGCSSGPHVPAGSAKRLIRARAVFDAVMKGSGPISHEYDKEKQDSCSDRQEARVMVLHEISSKSP